MNEVRKVYDLGLQCGVGNRIKRYNLLAPRPLNRQSSQDALESADEPCAVNFPT
jgi:hypothetical protein